MDRLRLQVVAAVLRDSAGRVLLAERLDDPEFKDLWEFPGGKLEPQESPEDALRRELGEELGIEPVELRRVVSVDHDYPRRRVHIDFFLVTKWRLQIRPMDGQGLRWVSPADLDEADLMPANGSVVAALRSLASLPAWRDETQRA
ncbi:MAG: 8-oxo-dGTP diphosphatase MutT [Woeseia sp.]